MMMVVVVAGHQMMSFFMLSASRPPLRLFLHLCSALPHGSSTRHLDSFTCNSITNSPSFRDRLFLHYYLFFNKWLFGYFNLFSVQWHFNFCLGLYRTLCRC